MNMGERERQGGHHVSEAVIRRRFHGGLVNFEAIDRLRFLLPWSELRRLLE